MLAHRRGEADQFVRALALHGEADEQAGDLGRRGFPAHDRGHGRRGLSLGEVFVTTEPFDEFGEHHASSRKFLRS